MESWVVGNAKDSEVGKDGPGRAIKGGMTGEPEGVKVDASARGPKDRRKGDESTAGSGRGATAGEGGDTPVWDTIDDPRGRGADWLDRRITAVGSRDTVEGQRG